MLQTDKRCHALVLQERWKGAHLHY